MEKFNPTPKSPEKTALPEKMTVWEKVVAGIGVVVFSSVISTAGNLFREKLSSLLDENDLDGRVAVTNLDTDTQEKISLIKQNLGTGTVLELWNFSERTVNGELPLASFLPKIEGFEKSEGVSNRDIQIATSTSFFPKGWIEGKINSIRYAPEEVIHIKEGHTAGGSNTKERDGSSSVTFYAFKPFKIFKDQERDKFVTLSLALQVLRHEVCHSNDWESNSPYVLKDRIQLLGGIAERVESSDPYRGHMLEDQGKEVPYHLLLGYETKMQKYVAYKEYFADICEAYFTNPRELEIKYPKDYRLIDDWISKLDPDFKLKKIPSGPFSTLTGEVLPEWKNAFK